MNIFWKQREKISIKINLATDEGNTRNETWHWTNDKIGVAVQIWELN